VKVLYWILGVVVGGFAFIMIVGTMLRTPESDARRDRQEEINALCDRAMSDAALGQERRNTRAICDDLKARAAKK